MGDEAISGVIDTIDSANQHKLRLAELLSSLQEAKSQVQTSSNSSVEELTEHFAQLKAQIISTIDARFQSLLSQIKEIKTSAITPLIECEALINKDIEVASQILQQGKTLLSGDHESNQSAMVEYKAKANAVGLASLPEVPALCEVACVFVETPEVLRAQLITDVGDYGRVISRAPVQITSVLERPGSLLIKWAELEEEDGQDLVEFCLQYQVSPSNNNTGASIVQHQVLVGAALSHTLRHIQPLRFYTCRVRGRAEGREVWSPWSVPHTGMTTIPHYEWREDVEGYTTGTENRIGERLASPEKDLLLFSKGNTYTCGNSIIFRVVESCVPTSTTEANREEGLALTVTDDAGSLLRTGAIFVSADGRVFLDGQEKLTKLPALKRGSVVTFDTEVLSSGKVRVTVDVDEKIVTFDWSVEQSNLSPGGGLLSAISMGQGDAENGVNLYFAMRFCTEGWRIGVE